MNSLFLKKGRERSVKRRHPWVFSGAVEKVAGDAQPGETLQVRDIAAPLRSPSHSPVADPGVGFDLRVSRASPDFFRGKLRRQFH
jgi:hypothetical protein